MKGRLSAKWPLSMSVNSMHSTDFYNINTMVIYQFTVLLTFTYIMHPDLLK